MGVEVPVVPVVGGGCGVSADVMGVETSEGVGGTDVVVAAGRGFMTFAAVEGRWVDCVGCAWARAASSSSR